MKRLSDWMTKQDPLSASYKKCTLNRNVKVSENKNLGRIYTANPARKKVGLTILDQTEGFQSQDY